MSRDSNAGDDSWFSDAADARQYIGEVGKLWFVWLLGLGALAASSGVAALVVGVVLLVAMFILMSPLQNRIQERYGSDPDGRTIPKRETLSSRDKALRDLTYGRAPFAEAVDKRGLWAGLKLVPWVVVITTLVAAAIVAIQWLGG